MTTLVCRGFGNERRAVARVSALVTAAMITKQQYRRLMNEHQETGSVSESAMKAGMSRPTALKYLRARQLPEELQAKHSWRTRVDPLMGIWPAAQAILAEAPEL